MSENSKKNYFAIICVYLFLLLIPFFSQAALNHPFADKRNESIHDDEAIKIPVYEIVPKRAFEDLSLVQGNSFNKKEVEVVRLQMQRAAYKIKADAIIGVKCKLHGIGLTCEGMAVKWK